MSEQKKSGSRIVYIADPMCSWCYGFAPAIKAIEKQFEGRMPVKVMLGGLRAGNDKPMSDADKTEIAKHWEHVEEATGQQFDHSLFRRDGFIYDTEPACRAVVTARAHEPKLALGYLEAVSQAFYADGMDITDQDILADVAVEAGFDRGAFLDSFNSKESRQDTRRDFATVRHLGVRGFPTLVVGSDADGYALLSSGYRKLDELTAPLEAWFADNVA